MTPRGKCGIHGVGVVRRATSLQPVYASEASWSGRLIDCRQENCTLQGSARAQAAPQRCALSCGLRRTRWLRMPPSNTPRRPQHTQSSVTSSCAANRTWNPGNSNGAYGKKELAIAGLIRDKSRHGVSRTKKNRIPQVQGTRDNASLKKTRESGARRR